jgi:hypothetical protein
LCYLSYGDRNPAITPLVEEPRSSTLAGASSLDPWNQGARATLGSQCIGAIFIPSAPIPIELQKPACPRSAGFFFGHVTKPVESSAGSVDRDM